MAGACRWAEPRRRVLQIVKNKCAAPYKLAEFDILFGSGISGSGCILDAAEAVGLIQKKGSWYSYGETRLAQGREKTLAMLQENAEMLKCVCLPAGATSRLGLCLLSRIWFTHCCRSRRACPLFKSTCLHLHAKC